MQVEQKFLVSNFRVPGQSVVFVSLFFPQLNGPLHYGQSDGIVCQKCKPYP